MLLGHIAHTTDVSRLLDHIHKLDRWQPKGPWLSKTGSIGLTTQKKAESFCLILRTMLSELLFHVRSVYVKQNLVLGFLEHSSDKDTFGCRDVGKFGYIGKARCFVLIIVHQGFPVFLGSEVKHDNPIVSFAAG